MCFRHWAGVELRAEPSVQKPTNPVAFGAVLHPNIRNNVNSYVFSFGDGSRPQASFEPSTTHLYRKHGMWVDAVCFFLEGVHFSSLRSRSGQCQRGTRFVKFPQGGQSFGFWYQDRECITVWYKHLVEGHLQCLSLHLGGSTGEELKSTLLNLFVNSSREIRHF